MTCLTTASVNIQITDETTYERYLNYLRELSYQHSDECLEFTRSKLQAHRYFMISC